MPAAFFVYCNASPIYSVSPGTHHGTTFTAAGLESMPDSAINQHKYGTTTRVPRLGPFEIRQLSLKSLARDNDILLIWADVETRAQVYIARSLPLDANNKHNFLAATNTHP